MPADPLLLDRLKSYLVHQLNLDGARLYPEFSWPSSLLTLKESFPSFEWLCSGDPPQTRLFGIRQLVGQLPFRLSELRARGYRTESIRHPVRPPIKGSVEHYLIVELLSPLNAIVFLCMYAPSQEWYVLDEHRLSRSAKRTD